MLFPKVSDFNDQVYLFTNFKNQSVLARPMAWSKKKKKN